ncbi:hypothetical protein G3R49_19340 [Shewanella sp. WXL01]|nr:hypothetical protein [Shewanella sp. WXL01]NKF52714.1 hypothetical protein [Shewanella sp. WXL01]
MELRYNELVEAGLDEANIKRMMIGMFGDRGVDFLDNLRQEQEQQSCEE